MESVQPTIYQNTFHNQALQNKRQLPKLQEKVSKLCRNPNGPNCRLLGKKMYRPVGSRLSWDSHSIEGKNTHLYFWMKPRILYPASYPSDMKNQITSQNREAERIYQHQTCLTRNGNRNSSRWKKQIGSKEILVVERSLVKV